MKNQAKTNNTQANDRRTEHAFEAVKKIVEKNENFQKEFRSAARSFPTMVHNNGLSAAIAFLKVKMVGEVKDASGKQKEKNHYDSLYESLEGWLVEIGRVSIDKNEDGRKAKDLLEAVVKMSRDRYRIVTEEVMIYSQWIKRFAEGMLSKDEQNG